MHQVSANGVLVLTLDDGTIMQYQINAVSVNVDTEIDEFESKTMSGGVAVSYSHTYTDANSYSLTYAHSKWNPGSLPISCTYRLCRYRWSADPASIGDPSGAECSCC